MDKKTEPFILIPLCALTQMWVKDWSYKDLLNIGMVVSSSKEKSLAIKDQAKQLLDYGYLAVNAINRQQFGNWVVRDIANATSSIAKRDEYFIAYDLKDYLAKHEDNIVELWCKVLKLCLFMKIEPKQSFHILDNGMDKLDYCRRNEGLDPCLESSFELPPYILVSSTIIQNFIKLQHFGNEMDKARRLMFMGIASIIGRNKLASTTSDMIKARMFGFHTPQALTTYYNAPNHEVFRALYDKYTTRRRYDYMLKDLKIEGLIGEVPYKRRTVVSMRIKSDLELLNAVSNNNKSRQRQQVTENLKKAKEQFKEMKQ